jgi:immunoglobulin-like protein involved in spore germination/sporulation and spore germination protein
MRPSRPLRSLALLLMLVLAACGSAAPATRTPAPDAAATATRAAERAQLATLTAPPATGAATPTGVPPPTGTAPPAPPPAAATPPPAPSRTGTAGPTTALAVYFFRDGTLAAARRHVPATRAVGEAAVRELLAGPTPAERALGYATEVPGDAAFLDLAIADRLATVDLSRAFAPGGAPAAGRVAQVVFTLTQFPTVDGVRLRLAGRPVAVVGGAGAVLDRPVGRADYEALSPAILVESPVAGERVASPLRLRGTANTFEAAFVVKLVGPDGRALVERGATATSGSGTRGTFDLSVPFAVERAGRGTLLVFEESARDGAPIHVVEIPLDLRR